MRPPPTTRYQVHYRHPCAPLSIPVAAGLQSALTAYSHPLRPPRSTYTRITHCTCIAPHRTRHVKAVRFVSSLHVPFLAFPFFAFLCFFILIFFYRAFGWVGRRLRLVWLVPPRLSSGTHPLRRVVSLFPRRSPVDMPVIAHVPSKGGCVDKVPECVCACVRMLVCLVAASSTVCAMITLMPGLAA
ncbi:hypothetical protein BKA56DRAFT_249074 [Ilyonectria sp. MPI-CAGE-AT-0026]|nr:hypothetical protein BKA56DRAFT_249074 [Ilyonectria sp. MPI-CAGE-AT-0026]